MSRRLLLLWALSPALFLFAQQPVQGPAQPVPFSHKWHAGTLKLECRKCHANPDPGLAMTIAKPPVCLQCHATIKTDSPHIQKLAAAAADDIELKWVRIYRVPSYVYFNHRLHNETGNTCEDCHGKVAERERLYREKSTSMGTCMQCHKDKKVSVDCAFCHEPR